MVRASKGFRAAKGMSADEIRKGEEYFAIAEQGLSALAKKGYYNKLYGVFEVPKL